jgi:hypothetical protein
MNSIGHEHEHEQKQKHVDPTPVLGASSAVRATAQLSSAVASLQLGKAKEVPNPACRSHPGQVFRKVVASNSYHHRPSYES